MRPGRTPPSPTCACASLGSRSQWPRSRSPRPTTAPPPATPPQDRPRELAGVSAPSCPCSAPQVPGTPTTSRRPTPTRSPPSPSPAAAYHCAHPTRPDPRAAAAAEGVPTAAYYGEDTPRPVRRCMWYRTRICGLPRVPIPRARVNKARSRPAEPNPSGFAGPTTTRKPWYSSWWRRLLGRYKRRGFCLGIQVRDSNPNYSRSGIGPYLFLASSRFRECLFRRRYVTWRRILGFDSADPGHTAPQTLRSQPAARC